MVERWGEECADVVAQRLAELEAVECLADLALFPHLRITVAASDVSVDGSEPVRLLLTCPETGGEGAVAWDTVTAVVVVDVVIEETEGGDKDSDG